MNIAMLFWIVQRFTKLGDVILDPMAGAGTTMLACWLGRNVLLVELEQKFIDMCNANWEKLRQMPPALGFEMGWCEIRQGDARELDAVVDCAIFSPPYAEQLQRWGNSETKTMKQKGLHQESKQGIGALPYGSLDAAIFSPPYSSSFTASGDMEARAKRVANAHPDKRNPWAEAADPNYKCPSREHYGDGYSTDPSNIGNLPHGDIDAIISSPPYEAAQATEDDNYVARHITGGQLATHHVSNNNIGNLKGDTYLSAMQQVYFQCHKALKPNGLMILVVKNFIRNQEIVPLDEHTIKLCEGVGFTLKERHHRKLTSQSFWRVIYQKKYPNAPVIDKEDILVLSP